MSKKKKKSGKGIVKKEDASATSGASFASSAGKQKTPQKTPEKTIESENTRAFTSQRIIASALFLAALGLLAFVGIFIWGALGTPKSIASYLPRTTVAFAEINTNLESRDWKELKSAFPNINPEEKLINTLKTFFGGDPQKDIMPWISRNSGVAVLKNGQWIGFFEVKDTDAALNFFRNRTLQGVTDALSPVQYKGETLYEYTTSNGSVLIFLGNYLVMTPNENIAHDIVDATQNPDMQLKTDPAFLAARQSLPRKLLGNAYINAPLMLSQEFDTQSPLSSSLDTLKKIFIPTLSKIITSEIIGMKPWNGMLAIEHTALLSDDARATGKNLRPTKKYRAKLMEFFGKETGFFMGGQNVSEMIDKINTWQKIDEFLSQQVRDAFDERITLQEIKGLLRDEYAIGNDGGWKIVIKLDDPETQKNILKKMLLGMQSSRLILAPARNNGNNTQSDGTPADMILTGIAKDLTIEQKKYKDIAYNALQTTPDASTQNAQNTQVANGAAANTTPTSPAPAAVTNDTGMFIAVLDDKAVITFSEKALKDTIDLWTASGFHFGQADADKKAFDELLSTGDDLFYINKKYDTNGTWQKYFPDSISQIFTLGQRVIVSSNAFEEGIKTIVLIAP